MKRLDPKTPIFAVTVTVPSEAEDATGELLAARFAQPAAIYANAETRVSTATVYWKQRVSPKELRQLQEDVRALAEFGLPTANASVSCQRVKREDWSESWKKYFKTIEIGSRLLIKPSWSKQKPKKGQAVVVLDPGLSFGTGQHATTSFCLRELVRHRGAQPQALLDIGSGSGILAISAAKLGYAPIEAFDFDPLAVRIANANARRNRVDSKVRFTRKDLTKLPAESRRQFDVICANLMADLLIGEKARILARLAPEGVLILAGILVTEFRSLQKTFEASGLRLVTTRIEREWQSGQFRRG